ncbi:MAG TPA: T9SS type A sorting domain-containing protein, partial [Chitinophagaceae bacterium]
TSTGLNAPVIEEIPSPDDPPQWLHIKIYPNPANNELTINVAFDTRWVGKELTIINVLGQVAMKKMISSKIQAIDISKLQPGVYFISAKKEGDNILEKFVKF